MMDSPGETSGPTGRAILIASRRVTPSCINRKIGAVSDNPDTTIDGVNPDPVCRAPAWIPWMIAAAIFCFYVAFVAKLYDGDALKQSGCLWGPVDVAGANHPYTGLYFSFWWSAIKSFAPQDFVGRMSWLEAMSSLFGAGAVGFTAAALRRLGLATAHVVLGALILGFSTAWIYHATQTTEPMVAQFFLMASLWASVRWKDSAAAAGVAGVLWAVSVASYQSYFLAGPAMLLIAAPRLRAAIAWVACAGVVGTLLFVAAAVLSGAKDVSGVVGYLATKPDGGYWGFFRLSQAVRVPLGMVQAIAVPWPTKSWPGLMGGFGSLSTGGRALLVAQSLATLGFAIWAMLAPAPKGLGRTRALLLVGLACGLFAPFYLLPLYNKLWVFPISFLILLGAIAAGRSRHGTWILAGMLAIQVAANVPRVAVAGSDPHNPGLLAAIALRESIQGDDLLICDGWDDSGPFCAMYPRQSRVLVMFHLSGIPGLEKRIAQAHAAGRRVFVYGLVNRTAEQWAISDMGFRPGLIRHADFAPIRERAKLVWLGADKGCYGDLYELPPAR